MRHKKKGRKLGTDASHTKAMLKSLAVALFTNERIKTTEARAKEVRAARRQGHHVGQEGRRALASSGHRGDSATRNSSPRSSTTRERFEGRAGGYTRILKLGPRKGDAAPMVIMELVD